MASVFVSKTADTITVDAEHKHDPDKYEEAAPHLEVSQGDADSLDEISSKEQARIYRKVDWRLVPMLTLLYFFSNLDRFVWRIPRAYLVNHGVFLCANTHPWRANIGNAKIQGLEASLKMKGSDYNVASMIFFVPYILFEIPSNAILLKFKRPSAYIGILAFCWGTVMTCSGVVGTFGGLVATRFLLGAFE